MRVYYPEVWRSSKTINGRKVQSFKPAKKVAVPSPPKEKPEDNRGGIKCEKE